MLLIDVQRKKGCAERILRVASESYYRVPRLQQNQQEDMKH
jgi:hypothetical protein